MKFFKLGEKSKALCEDCNQVVSMTFQERTIPFSSGKGQAEGILAGVCDLCDRVISIPQQSVPRIQETLRSKKVSIEARLPRHLLDVLSYACHSLGVDAGEEAGAVLLRYYIEMLDSSPALSSSLKKHLTDELSQGKAQWRCSLKVSRLLKEMFEGISMRTQLSKTDLLKGILLQIKQDLLEEKVQQKIKVELRRAILAAS